MFCAYEEIIVSDVKFDLDYKNIFVITKKTLLQTWPQVPILKTKLSRRYTKKWPNIGATLIIYIGLLNKAWSSGEGRRLTIEKSRL